MHRQRNQTTTSTRLRVGQFHHFSHRLAAVHGGQLKRGSARVRVTQKDGTVLENLRTAPKSIGEPLSTEAVVAKCHTLIQSLMERERAEAIVSTVLGLEDLSDIQPFVSLIAPAVRSTFE